MPMIAQGEGLWRAVAGWEGWGRGLLNDFWRDVGVIVTFVAFVVAIWQLWRTANAAYAASRAAREAAEESRKAFARYVVSEVQRIMNEMNIHVAHCDWSKAAMRLTDLADRAAKLGYLEDPPAENWLALAKESREWQSAFDRKGSRVAMTGSQSSKWTSFTVRFNAAIDGLAGSFSVEDPKS